MRINEVSPHDITGVNSSVYNRLFQEFEVRMVQLQQQVDMIQISLKREKLKRLRLERRIKDRLRVLLDDIAGSFAEESDEEAELNDNLEFPFDNSVDVFESMFDRDANDKNGNKHEQHTSSGQESSSQNMHNEAKRSREQVQANVNRARAEIDHLSVRKTNNSMDVETDKDTSSHELLDSFVTPQTDSTPFSHIADNQQMASGPSHLIFEQSTHHQHEDLGLLIDSDITETIGHRKRLMSDDPSHKKKRTARLLNSLRIEAPSKLDEDSIKEKYGVQFSERCFTVKSLWKEYNNVGAKGISLRNLEEAYESRWRMDLNKNVKKKYYRRMLIIKAILAGMKKGKTEEQCIDILDQFLIENKCTLSFLFKKSNIPFNLLQ